MNLPTRTTQGQPDPSGLFTTHDLTGSLSDVLYAVGRYREMGALVATEQLPATADGPVTARVRLLPGTPLLPVGPPDEREQWSRGDYIIAGLTALKHTLTAGVALTLLWGLYTIAVGIGIWIGANTAVVMGILVALAVVPLVLILTARRGCVGIHCGGCRG